jgi:peptidylprolyl isomerase
MAGKTEHPKTEAAPAAPPIAVAAGVAVTLEYEGTLDDGTVFDTTKGREPLQYVHGTGMLLQAFESQTNGMKPRDEKSFTLTAKDGYGERDEALSREFPRSQFPPNVELQEGAMLVIKSKDGQPMLVRIAKLTGESATLDFNHPLAGKTLHFKVKVVGVAAAPAEN